MAWVGKEGKELVCIADLLCKLASSSGIMQVNLADHDMEQAQDKLGQVVRRCCKVVVFFRSCCTLFVTPTVLEHFMCFLWLFTLFSSKFRFWPMCNTDWQDNGQLLNFR